jgi:CheY-like chemotaxis protein
MSNVAATRSVVLYADDDVDDLNLVKDAFEEHALNVELKTAYDGEHAIQTVRELINNNIVPCLIILDINMPRLNGKETLLKIRGINELEDTPVILFSTSSDAADRRFAEQNKAGFLTKPIEYKQMDEIINTFISHCFDDTIKSIRKN